MSRYLNKKEHEILNTIMHAEGPVNVTEIIKARPALTTNIVQPTIRKLLKLGLIEVADIVIERNILSRRFQPSADAPTIIQKMFVDEYLQFSSLVSKSSLFSALEEADKNPDAAQKEIAELEQLLKEYKQRNKS